MKLIVKLAKETEGRYRAWCPSLPGCWVQGKSYTEAWKKMDQAIHGYLAGLNDTAPRKLRTYLMTG